MPTLGLKSAAHWASLRPRRLGARAHELLRRVLPFRCDVPTLRRTIDLPVAAVPADVVIPALGESRRNFPVGIVSPVGVISVTLHPAKRVVTLGVVARGVGTILEESVVLNIDAIP